LLLIVFHQVSISSQKNIVSQPRLSWSTQELNIMKTLSRFSLLAALIAAACTFSTASMAATATGTANATVLTPIAIAATTALNFGTFAGNTAGTVVVSTAGARSATGGVVLATGGTVSAGAFTVTGTGSATFAVTYPGSFKVTSGSDTMAVQVAGAATGTLSSGTVSLPVGGTLTVGAAQAAGNYTGTYTMTVEYN
jgi:hypothetical protein